MFDKNYYLTTTLPYVNAEPHIGFALEIVRADVLARWQRQQGKKVFFNTGVDEHGQKIFNKAQELGVEPQQYCDDMAAKFQILRESLNLSYDNFIRTTDPQHQQAAQAFWQRCLDQGDIYKKNYQIKYCVGCELEKTESELVNDRCPLHPTGELELIDEENYFFRFSKYQQALLDFYDQQPDFVVPIFRFKEIRNFVAKGLEDFSISRLKSKMPWGVPVPYDNEQVMYVWFDALINYISCLGWPDNKKFSEFWPGIQICGKDNLRQQTAMWQAMLLSAGLPNSRQVLVNGFITANGQKMSKSLGNFVKPLELVEKYGTDAVRYYLLSEINPFEDSDYSDQKFAARYQADLANGLGNLVARVSNLLGKNGLALQLKTEPRADLTEKVNVALQNFLFDQALEALWQVLRQADEKISQDQPWTMTEEKDLLACLQPIAQDLLDIGRLLQIFLPQTGEKIVKLFSQAQISKGEPLFPRLDTNQA